MCGWAFMALGICEGLLRTVQRARQGKEHCFPFRSSRDASYEPASQTPLHRQLVKKEPSSSRSSPPLRPSTHRTTAGLGASAPAIKGCHPLQPSSITTASFSQNHNPHPHPHPLTLPRLPPAMAASLVSVVVTLSFLIVAASGGNLYHDFDITWGDGRAKILDNGQLLTLSLDKASGSGFQSKNEYLFGKIDMQLKLVPGNSAGTVTAYYLSSQGPTHDEIDFEFLGNLSGDPYTLHTNVFSQGKGNREQQFKLWFDPTKDFHTYSILWNPQHIIFSVDGIPIRDFRNNEVKGVPFPKSQPMRIYSSLWNADDWATMGGLVKTDWSKAPFVASYRNFNADACVWARGTSSCSSGKVSTSGSRSSSAWLKQELDATSQRRLRWVQRNYMIYNYCTDVKRFPQGLPLECTIA